MAYGQTDAGLPSTITPGTTTTTILPSSLVIHTGNSVTETTLNQVLLQGTTTNNAHAIKTRHNAAGTSDNAIDPFVWQYGTDAATTVGSKQALTISQTGVGINQPYPTSALQVNGYTSLSSAIVGGSLSVAGSLSSSGQVDTVAVRQPNLARISIRGTNGTSLNFTNASNINVPSTLLPTIEASPYTYPSVLSFSYSGSGNVTFIVPQAGIWSMGISLIFQPPNTNGFIGQIEWYDSVRGVYFGVQSSKSVGDASTYWICTSYTGYLAAGATLSPIVISIGENGSILATSANSVNVALLVPV